MHALGAPQHTDSAPVPRRARRLALVGAGAAACAAIAWSVTGLAIAAGSGSPTVKAGHTSSQGEVVVAAGGRTLYELAPETTHHLLCTSAACFNFWPPLTVHSAKTKLKAGPGVSGHLAIFKRHNGVLQVTLNGRPLYRFSGDSANGQANGQGLMTFGGRWHVVAAHASAGAAPAPATQTPSPMTPTGPPGY